MATALRGHGRMGIFLAVMLAGGLGAPRADAQVETAGVCFCGGAGGIGIAQLIGAVNIALKRAPCPSESQSPAGRCFCNASGVIGISQLITAVNIALNRAPCPMVAPTATPATPSSTPPSATPSTPAATATATPVAGMPYANCGVGETCAPGGFCFVDGDLSVCVPQGCVSAADCAERPSGGNAGVECADGVGDGASDCLISCFGGAVCPNGMLCLAGQGFCVWPAQPVTPTHTPVATATLTASATLTATLVPTSTATVPTTSTLTPTLTPTPTGPTSTPTFTATSTSLPGPLLNRRLTVFDTNTGLEWAKRDALPDGTDLFTWSDESTGSMPDGTVFTQYVRSLNESTYAGHRDWRLPTSAGSETFPSGEAAEVEALVGCSGQSCLDEVFGSVPFDAYWSGSTLSQAPSSAWIAVIDSGAIVAEGKTNLHGARAVRTNDRGCDERPDGSTCNPTVDGAVFTCNGGQCAPCVAAPQAAPRFVDNQDGTVTDRSTCLVWEQKTGNYDNGRECSVLASCEDLHNVNNRYTWSASGQPFDGGAKRLFLDELNGMGEQRAGCFADHCDWRLPSELGRSPASSGPTELQDILGPLPCVGSPCIDPIFGPTAPAIYWSSTTNPDFTAAAWEADFEFGFLDGTIKNGSYHVRAVRGGTDVCANRPAGATCDAGVDGVVRTCEGGVCDHCVPRPDATPRWVDNGNGTVTDRETCLVWEKKTGHPSAPAVQCPGMPECNDPHFVGNTYTWAGTVPFLLEELNDVPSKTSCFADHCDWRLPSSAGFGSGMTGEPAELESIVDCGFGSPCISPVIGVTSPNDYWSSSQGGLQNLAWHVNFADGFVNVNDKLVRFRARAVRGGQ